MSQSIEIQFLGQAGFTIKNGKGYKLGIDLYLSDCVERYEGHIGFKRLLPRIITAADINADILIATHSHLDHFDKDAMPELMRKPGTVLYASRDCTELIGESGLDSSNIRFVKPGDSFEKQGFKLYFVHCDHGSAMPDAVGVIVETDGKRIFETGDTCLRLDRAEEYRAFGEIDVLIAPINGAFGNMNEEDCVRLAATLNVRLTIPCHYGMFASHGGDPGRFLNMMKKYYPQGEVALMAYYERLEL